MGLNDTPSGERIHIGFFGCRNAGKSSLVNAVTGQEIAIVSEIRGTTTDPVSKAMELLPIGPVMIIDTPGIDDEGSLGELRIRRTKQVLNKTDVAVLVTDAGAEGLKEAEKELIGLFREKKIPYIIAYNKSDLRKDQEWKPETEEGIAVSALTKEGIRELKEKIAGLSKSLEQPVPIISDLIHPGDFVVLVTPIDSAAPKGRLILPQQQTIRDILDTGSIAVVTREHELKAALGSLANPPVMVVTDSQAFERVAADTPADVALTSFSILMARHKGFLDAAVRGAAAVRRLKDHDRVLISEGCTHHRQCEDIGTVKLPAWLKSYTKAELEFEFSSGTGFPEDLSRYSLIIHCGGCMLNEKEVRFRMKCASDQGVPMTNYGVAIACMKGILRRSLEVFPHLAALIEED